MKASKLLFIRSVPMPVALRSVQALKRAYPEARLTVLTGTASVSSFESEQLADQVIPFQAPRFGVLAAGPSCIHRLRMGKFDRILVPYSGADWWPFRNVGRMALAIGGRATLWLPCRDPEPVVDLESCAPVLWRSFWMPEIRRTILRARRALLGALKWPFLCVFYIISMVFLALLAVVLVPLVWLKPPPCTDKEQA